MSINAKNIFLINYIKHYAPQLAYLLAILFLVPLVMLWIPDEIIVFKYLRIVMVTIVLLVYFPFVFFKDKIKKRLGLPELYKIYGTKARVATFLLSAPAMFASTYISADYLEILMSDKNYTATLSEVSTNPEKYENVCCFKFDNAMPGSLLENPLIGFDTKMYFEKRPSKRNDGGLAGVFHRTVPLLQQDWQENSHPVTVWLALAYAHYRDEEIMKDYKLRKYAIRVEREDRYFYNKAIQGDNSDSSSENKPNITVYLFKSLDEFISWKRSWTLFWTGLILFIWFVICINNYFSVRPKS